MKSFLTAFKNMKAKHADCYELIADTMIVEEIPPPEQKTKGGIIIPTTGGKMTQVTGMEMDRPVFVRVLDVGNGYYDEENDKLIDLGVVPGDVVLVGRVSAQRLSTFGPLVSESGRQLAITRESEVKLRFKSDADYDKCMQALAESLAEEPAA